MSLSLFLDSRVFPPMRDSSDSFSFPAGFDDRRRHQMAMEGWRKSACAEGKGACDRAPAHLTAVGLKTFASVWGFRTPAGFAVFHCLLGEREPRFSHREKRQSAFGIRNSRGELNTMSGMQAIARRKLVRGHHAFPARTRHPRTPNGNPAHSFPQCTKIRAKTDRQSASRRLCNARAQESRKAPAVV